MRSGATLTDGNRTQNAAMWQNTAASARKLYWTSENPEGQQEAFTCISAMSVWSAIISYTIAAPSVLSLRRFPMATRMEKHCQVDKWLDKPVCPNAAVYRTKRRNWLTNRRTGDAEKYRIYVCADCLANWMRTPGLRSYSPFERISDAHQN
jgi:hypothetical protein